MIYNVHVGQDLFQAIGVAYVAPDQFHVVRQVRGWPFGMNLHRQIIQYANAMSGLQKTVGQVRTYKSGPTRDQYLVAHARTVPLRDCVTLAGVVLGAYLSTAHAAKSANCFTSRGGLV